MIEAQKDAKKLVDKGFVYSFDMLGESALIDADAKKYLASYRKAIQSIGDADKGQVSNTISIKLSALHPRYEVANIDRVMDELCVRVIELIKLARSLDVAVTIDAE